MLVRPTLSPKEPRPSGSAAPPRIFGYRGATDRVPNTLPALLGHLADGAHGLALDVEITADGVLVAADDSLARACGLGRSIRELTFRALATVDLGSRLGTGGVVRLASLAELIDGLEGRAAIAVVLPDRRDHRIRAALERCPTDPDRTLAIGAWADALPRGIGQRILRWSGAEPLPSLADVDGLALPVFGTLGPLPLGGLRVGLGCDTPRAASEARRAGFDLVLTERPAWLRDRFDLGASATL